MSAFDYEVMIVGGGPAGISTWLHLHKLNPALAARTILLEKAVYPRQKLCGGGVTRMADLVLARLRIKINVPSVPIHRVEFRFGEKTYYLHQRNVFRVVRRHEFDHALAKAAAERGLRLHEGEVFEHAEPIEQGLRIETSRGKYRVRVLIGADGARSVVRRKMNLEEKPRLSRLIEILTPADAQHDSEFIHNMAVLDFGAVADGLQGYVWDFPCLEGGTATMNRGVFDSRVRPNRPRADLKEIFGQALRNRNAYREPRLWEGHPERWFLPEGVFSRPHILLVGDAAGVEPAFGEGISQALQYGAIAAAAIAEAFNHNDFSFSDYRDKLLAHPLGKSLRFQMRLAQRMYAGGPMASEKLIKLLSKWLEPA